MICVSLAEPTVDGCLVVLPKLEMAEIRLDLVKHSKADLRRLFSSHKNLIATFRGGKGTDDERRVSLLAAIESGASYVDIELESTPAYRLDLLKAAKDHGCKVIVSHHDNEKTPSSAELRELVRACFECGGEIAKVACRVQSQRDAVRLLFLLDTKRSVIPIGMGEYGRIVRVTAPLLGAPFTFACLEKGRETADGQIDIQSLKEILSILEHK